ncbi:MAG: penicillin-binding transpeptidase domain-containing protein [Microthrixaceae bacterium]
MNRQIKALGVVILGCYLALFIKLNQVQVLDADKYNDRPENTRQQVRDFNHPRGNIVSADGVLLARSDEQKGELQFQRVYPQGDLFAHITGYYSFALGSTGVERFYNDELTGRTPALRIRRIKGMFNEPTAEGELVLTVSSPLQQAIKDALGDSEGAVAVIEPSTGSILAMYSNPTFDPNAISSNDLDQAAKVKGLLDAAPSKPLLARTFQERFFPGSTFKIVTAAAGLESGKVTPDQPVYPTETSYTPPGTTRAIRNFDGSNCGGALFEILQRSCNAAFARMAAETLGPEPMIATAEAAGFNSEVPLDLPRPAESRYPTDFGALISRPEATAPIYENSAKLAQTGIGQNDVAATPLQMAMVAGAVANGGSVMRPHVMKEVHARDGAVVDTYKPAEWKRFTTPENAETLRSAMVGVVENGTASILQTPGLTIGAKTGTAQLGTDPPRSHAWMVAFAGPAGQPPSIAIAVIVQDVPGNSGATGGRIAGPIAHRIIQAALGL